MEDQSLDVLKSQLPAEWIVREVPKDYGVDLEIELVDQGLVTGNRVWVQLKSAQNTTRSSTSFSVGEKFPDLATDSEGNLVVEYLPYSLATKEIEYSLQCPFPLLLFLVDLAQKRVFWLPIRDEAIANLGQRNASWREQGTSTLRIPLWNDLAREREDNFPGLRWYAMEPARMYAFATLHYYHHEFQYTGRLSGYHIEDGWIDHGEEYELKSSLQVAHAYISAALQIDVLFGESGVDYFRLSKLPGIGVAGIAAQFHQALGCADEALKRLEGDQYTSIEMFLLVSQVSHAIDLLSTAIASYQGFRTKFLLTEGTAIWRAGAVIHGVEGAPIIPLARQPQSDNAKGI
jgi:hypothetical protein